MTTAPRISVLPDVVANKIAAGEVVERPASVVKELVENALDAGATQIDVGIVSGGRKLVSVADNGQGMTRDDALLCVERHATSKIRDVHDIEAVRTMGFRGEALAAISSVARFTLKTAVADAEAGTEILIAGGKIQDVRELGWPRGTTVEVRNLFFNVPARRKFLRAAQTELARVRQLFMVLALANPTVGFSLTVDGRETYRFPANAGLEDRLCEMYDAGYAKNLLPVRLERAEVKVDGYVGLPSIARSDRDEQYLFMNRRPASAPLLMYAVKEGYRTLLPADRNPSVFLFLTVPPDQLDVNVHPTKREVRFRQPGPTRDAVIAAIRRALTAGGVLADTEKPGERSEPASETPAFKPAADVRLPLEDLPPSRAFHYPRMRMGPGQQTQPGGATARAERVPDMAGSEQGEAEPDSPWAWCRVVGQIGALYVIMETEDGYVLMDPHAAHERVLFEQFMRDVRQGKAESQGLLMPETVKLAPKDAERVRKQTGVLREMGFGVSEFGDDSFIVDALPARVAVASPRAILLEMARALEQTGTRGAKAQIVQERIAQVACKAAVKARQKLTLEEIEKLVVDLAKTEMPYTCPHGRPTMIFTSFKDLNKKFGRE